MASAKSSSSSPGLPLAHSSSTTSFAPSSSSFASLNISAHRSLLPKRCGSASASSCLNFAPGRSASPKRNLQAYSPGRPVPPKAGERKPLPSVPARKVCLCSPSNHPGSFRCSLHRNSHSPSSSCSANSQLRMLRSAMTNSFVRIHSVERDLVKRALAALIRPSSHQIKRRTSFQPRPSRLSHMTTA